jgi:hypothetical protein
VGRSPLRDIVVRSCKVGGGFRVVGCLQGIKPWVQQ